MSDDDDFVTKPALRTYKRRRRTAPLAPVQPPVSPQKLVDNEFLSSKTWSPGKIPPVSHNNCSKLASEVPAVLRAKRLNAADEAAEDDSKVSELDAFLSSNSSVLARSVLELSCLPDLEVETVPKDENERNSTYPTLKEQRLSEEKVAVKEQIANIKIATKSLCSRVNGRKLRQSSLFSRVRGGSSSELGGNTTSPSKKESKNTENQSAKNVEGKSQVVSDQGEKKFVSPSKEPHQASSVPKTPLQPKQLTASSVPKTPLQPKQLIKQAGTSQLDLGSMFGLAPKHHDKKLIKQEGTSQLDLGAMFGLKAKHPKVEPKPDKPAKRSVPFHKWVRGTTFTVDAFNFGEIPKCTAYFLSHFHSDHYMGLNKHFTGIVYCSKVTSNYVINNLKVSPDRVKVLEFDQIEVVQGVEVSLITANHCPGSAMFLFESPSIGSILHTGDFRYNATMLSHPLLLHKPLSVLYLDTTYCDPLYKFPLQEDVIQYMVGQVLQFTRDTLIVCGSYTIGKERIVEGIAKVLDCKICVNQTKMNLIKMQENKELTSRLSKNINSRLHIVPMKEINPGSLSKLLARTTFSSVVGVKPTGWTHNQNTDLADIRPSGSGKVRIYPVPYSEHSSYSELEEFVTSLSVNKVIATVFPREAAKRTFMFEKLKQWTLH